MNGSTWRRLWLKFLIIISVLLIPGQIVAEKDKTTVEMLVFVDFYCPHCHAFEMEVVPALEKEFGSKLQVRTMGYPVMRKDSSNLIGIFLVAEQFGKGEAIKNLLFKAVHDPTPSIQVSDLEGLIRETGLDPEMVRKMAGSARIQKIMADEIDLANSYSVQGTPGVVINKVRIDEHSLSHLSYVIHKELEKVPRSSSK